MRRERERKEYRNESTNPKFIFRLTITDRGWFARMGEHRMKMQAAARRQAGERKGKGEEETGEENGRCLFYEVAKTYDIPTKWFPFRVFDFLFPFFLAQLPSPPLSSPFLVFSSPFLPRFQQLFHEKHKLRSRIMAKWHARSRSLISLSTSRHPSKRNRKRKRRGKREKGRRRPGSLSHEHFFTSVIGRPYVSRERGVCVRACYVITSEEGNIERRKPITLTLEAWVISRVVSRGWKPRGPDWVYCERTDNWKRRFHVSVISRLKRKLDRERRRGERFIRFRVGISTGNSKGLYKMESITLYRSWTWTDSFDFICFTSPNRIKLEFSWWLISDKFPSRIIPRDGS